MGRKTISLCLSTVVLSLGTAVEPVKADAIADFYRGKTISIHVGAGVGSGIDLATRMVARNIGRHIPGQPTVLVKNMIGGGGLQLFNYLYSIAPKDGTEFGAVVQFPFEFLFDAWNTKANFDAVKFTWIGGPVDFAAVAVAWNASTPVRKAEDLLSHELIIAASSATSGSATDAYVARASAILPSPAASATPMYCASKSRAVPRHKAVCR